MSETVRRGQRAWRTGTTLLRVKEARNEAYEMVKTTALLFRVHITFLSLFLVLLPCFSGP
jgi:hypothetical protein